jgi:hypothetical protein
MDSPSPVVQATVLQDPVKQIQVPDGLNQGDSFVYHDEFYGSFTVIVPPDLPPGGFINVVIPSQIEVVTSSDDEEGKPRKSSSKKVIMDRAVLGAAATAGIAGALTIGPICGIVLAGGAAYLASSKKKTPVGRAVRKVGEGAANGAVQAKRWVDRKLRVNKKKKN